MKKILKRFAVGTLFAMLFAICLFLGVKNTEAQAASKTAISKCTITVKDAVYTGKKAVPKVTVKFKKNTLKEGTDYKLTFKNNKSCGQASCVVEGIGKYTGKVTKNFKVVPATIKKVKFITDTYTDYEGNEVQDISFKYDTVKGATGYKLYFSDSKNGYFREVKRVEAAVDQIWINFAPGTYIKMQPYFFKNGKYYDAEMSKAFKVDYKPMTYEMKSYKVTNKALKAPSSVKLVYESRTTAYGDVLNPELCLKVTNGADISCSLWVAVFYDKYGNDMGTLCAATEDIAPGEDTYIAISDNVQSCIDRGATITKIRVIPGDGGSDNCYSTPWFTLESDDTFGEEYVLDCNISSKMSYAGKAAISFAKDEWGDTASLSSLTADYQTIEFVASDRFSREGEERYVRASFYRYDGHYNTSVYEYSDDIKKNPEKYTFSLCGAYEVNVKNDNTAVLLFHNYDVTVK